MKAYSTKYLKAPIIMRIKVRQTNREYLTQIISAYSHVRVSNKAAARRANKSACVEAA